MRPLAVWTLAIPATALALWAPAPRNDAAAEMTAAAERVLTALTDAQRQEVSFPFAGAERKTWHFVPNRYPGVLLGDLDPTPRRLVHDLLRTALSSAGYLKTTSIMALEGILHELESTADRSASHRDPERYALAIFGKPSAEGAWGWRLQGHHVSLNFSVVGGELIATSPAFLGANPHEVRQGPQAGLRVLGTEEDLGRSLLASLTDAQRGQAILEIEAPRDVVLGPGRAADFLGAPKGLGAATMTEAQRARLWRLITEYAHNLRPELADWHLQRIRDAGLEQVHFAWAGSATPGEGHYYRVHGKTFVLEYDNTQNDANHVHTVWRDLQFDFGGDLLQRHHKDHEHGK